jgi:hypothetical protein
VVEINAGAPLVRITSEFRVPFGKAGELDLMANLALRFGKMSNVKVFTVMLLVAGRAGQLTRFHSTNISDGRPGPEQKRWL